MSERPEPVGVLILVGVVLLLLAAVSFVVSFFALGPWETPVALTIAAVKAFGIGGWFMELRHARVSIRVAILGAISLFVLLVGLTTLDVCTRAPPPLLVPEQGGPPSSRP